MKLLLDENLPRDLKQAFPEHDARLFERMAGREKRMANCFD